ncbi:unnamed protein product [Wuchereria bancrofti]|uniref:ABC transmembrane type-1 domain-containing protein n=1 Tax=Wuchereria bancrofti TaxID=6293 RepID=A0A3P7FSG3_WUCBA|nr:unnamed protein product [Wuchereria bancrofti]
MKEKSSWKNKFDGDTKVIRHASFIEILRYAERRDYILLAFGITLSLVSGAISPISSVFFRVNYQLLLQGKLSITVRSFSTFAKMLNRDNKLEIGMTDALIAGQSSLKNGTFNLEMSCFITLSERQTHEIRKRFFAALLRQQMAWYDKNETGVLINKLSAGIDRIKDGIGDKFSILLQASTHFIFGIIIGLYYSWNMTLLILLIAPFIIMLLFGYFKVSSAVFYKSCKE